MPKRIHGMPPCPACGHRSSRVVSTTDALNGEFDIVRRRRCKNCDYRWYTGQRVEVALDRVKWTDDFVYMTWSEKDQKLSPTAS